MHTERGTPRYDLHPLGLHLTRLFPSPQPTVIDEVRTGTYRQLFHPGKQPCACSYTATLCMLS